MLSRLAAAAVLVAAGCGAPWHVVRASPSPSPLGGATAWSVAFDYGGLEVEEQAEAAWLEAQDEGDRAEYLALRAALEGAVLEALGSQLAPATVSPAASAPSDAHQLTVRFERMAFGSFAPIYSVASRLDATLAFGTASGVTDEIEVRTSRRADVYNPRREQRLGWCATRIGELAAEYVSRAR